MDASAPSVTRATGPIQPRFTASTKKKTIPSSVTAPPAQASAFAPNKADQSISLRTRAGFGTGLAVRSGAAGGGVKGFQRTGVSGFGSGRADRRSSSNSCSRIASRRPKSSNRYERSVMTVCSFVSVSHVCYL